MHLKSCLQNDSHFVQCSPPTCCMRHGAMKSILRSGFRLCNSVKLCMNVVWISTSSDSLGKMRFTISGRIPTSDNMPALKTWGKNKNNTWWRHQMETFSALLALCAGNSPVTGEFPSQRPVKWSLNTQMLIAIWSILFLKGKLRINLSKFYVADPMACSKPGAFCEFKVCSIFCSISCSALSNYQ